MHTKRELLALLEAHGIRLGKRLGQSYLVDVQLARALIASCALQREDRVIEIGPGLGALTQLLAQATGQVVAVEVDRAVAHALTQRAAVWPNVRVIEQDILEFPWDQYPGRIVVGALPYSITSPILLMLCERAREVPSAWLAMQREVADRLTAQPGSKSYSRLTLLVQYHFAVHAIRRMPRTAFFPEPRVDSMWLRFTRHAKPPVAVRDERLLFNLIRAAFAQRRKMLAGAIADLRPGVITRTDAAALLKRLNLRPDARGETLSLHDFARLSDALSSIFHTE